MIKVADFRNTILMNSKLRNGIFYLGNKRSLLQNEGGDIVYDASMDEHPKKLTLFEKFEKISLCLIRDDYIVLVKRSLSKGPDIVYNQATNTKHVEKNFYPLLEAYYYEKYPWKDPNLKFENDNDIKINQAGDLVLWQLTFSCWISACRKIKFNKVIMPSHGKLLYLQSSDDVHAYYAFNVSEKKFYCISRVPEYNEYEISEWFDTDIPSFQSLQQSLIGYYFGAYLVILKAWVDRFKSCFLHKDEII